MVSFQATMRGVDCSNGEHTTVNTSTTSVMLHDLAPNAEYSVEVAVTTSVETVGPYSQSLLYITGTVVR